MNPLDTCEFVRQEFIIARSLVIALLRHQAAWVHQLEHDDWFVVFLLVLVESLIGFETNIIKLHSLVYTDIELGGTSLGVFVSILVIILYILAQFYGILDDGCRYELAAFEVLVCAVARAFIRERECRRLLRHFRLISILRTRQAIKIKDLLWRFWRAPFSVGNGYIVLRLNYLLAWFPERWTRAALSNQ